MIVSKRYGFAWLHNPKAAGTSFRTSIAGYHDWPTTFWNYALKKGHIVDMAHLPLWRIRAMEPDLWKLWPDLRTLVFVRDPLRRFVSACCEHYENFDPPKDLQRAGPRRRQVRVASIMGRLTPSLARSDYRYAHFIPQRDYVFLDAERVVQTDYRYPIWREHMMLWVSRVRRLAS